MIYWVILAACLCTYPLVHKKLKLIDGNIIDGKKLYIILVGLALILIAGFRSTDVGADSAMYKKIFDWAANGNSFVQEYYSWHSGGTEFL